MLETILHGQSHWIWIPVALSFGCCIGYVAAMLFNRVRLGGEYYPSIEDAEHLYQPRRLHPKVEK